ncbi:MAG: hypothetical protein H6621_05675 [Halobacteriovoraceae bacterium]|nr:hypothetical protein [Halobacteriovoraceae bacterium]
MLKAIGFLVTFIVTFLILSIPVKKEKLVFDYLHGFAHPYMSKTYYSMKRLFVPKAKKAIEPVVQEVTSTEKIEVLNDEIKEKISEIINNVNGENQENKTIEEAKKDPHQSDEDPSIYDDYDFRDDTENL